MEAFSQYLWGCLFPHHSKTRDNNLSICEYLAPSHQTHPSLKRSESRSSLLNSHLYLSDWSKPSWTFLFFQNKKRTHQKTTHPFSPKVNQVLGLLGPPKHTPCRAVCDGSSGNFCNTSGCGNNSSTGNRCGEGVGHQNTFYCLVGSWLYGFLVAWCLCVLCFSMFGCFFGGMIQPQHQQLL